MAQNKTTENNNSVEDYLNAINDEKKRKDCIEITKMFQDETGFKPKMWGTGIVGFGSYHYKYEGGREGDAPLAGFAARVQNIVLYLSSNYPTHEELLKKLGKTKKSKVCIYIKQLKDIDTNVLKQMIGDSVRHTKVHHC